MSEEESFVILGSSPTPSMEAYTSLNSSTIQETLNKKSTEEQIAATVDEPAISYNDFSEYFHASRENTTPTPGEDKSELIETDGTPVISLKDQTKLGPTSMTIEAKKSLPMQEIFANEKMKNSAMAASFATLGSSTHECVAADFLLGEVTNDVLKSNIFTQFPSLCSSNTSAEDIMKLQNLMCEYVDMKDNLQRTNSMMRQHFSVLKKWQKENESFKFDQSEQMNTQIQAVAKLMNENKDLKRELDSKMVQLTITEKTMREENENLIQSNSEKLSIINNLSKQIEKLEQDKLKSYEYIPRIDEKENAAGPSKENILKEAHNEVIKANQPSYSELLAINLDFHDMKQTYIDEIDCLKVNLVSAEEVIKQQQADISFLKSKDIEKSERFDDFQQEIQLLKAQLEVYSKDFEMERTARQEETAKNEQLLSDLTLLQRRNQELLEQNEIHRVRVPSRRSPAEVGVPAREEQVYNRTNFVCPLCAKCFKELSTLHVHVQECLDK